MKKRTPEVTTIQPPRVVRCAVYTRKSTEEGLEQEFNSLDAQRESGEAYIQSQIHEGWTLVPTRYDDGGFTGANMDRPALQRLLADIDARRVDCVVVYKVDRLSRSLLDFTRILETFDRHNVAFVSVTQAFNTASSMGRLVLNVLLSFAQFEREMISERTRDKIAAARRKGKWSGGMPVLGYTVVDTKLIVDPKEAEQVREIFRLYLEHRSLLAVVNELQQRDWRTKRWTTKAGIHRGGRVFDKASLHHLLTSVTYIGKIRYKDEVHTGEQTAIVEPTVFAETQQLLTSNARKGGPRVRQRVEALLAGRLHCASCDCAMSPSSTNKGTRRYRYYVCVHGQKRGWHTCPCPSIPAGEVEKFVVDQIRGLGRNPEVLAATLGRLEQENDDHVIALKATRKSFGKRLAKLRSLEGADECASRPEREHLQRELERIDRDLAQAELPLDSASVVRELSQFDALWQQLSLREQGRIIALLIERVSYHAKEESLRLTLSATGVRTLVAQQRSEKLEPVRC